MFIYTPFISSKDRVVWYGGFSTQLHYEVQDDVNPNWIERDVRTLGEGIPTGVKELLDAMKDYYQDCTSLEMERLQEMAD